MQKLINFKLQIIICIICIISKNGFSQDIHFSQFFSSSFNLNPALPGQIEEDFRLSTVFRNQWAAISKNGYQTFATAIEKPLKNDKFGTGLSFFHDKAGDSKLITNSINISVSRKIKLNDKNDLILGFQPAWTQRSIDLSQNTWDSQYDGQIFNSTLPTGEKINTENFNYFDISSGLYWKSKINDKLKINIGLAGFHLNRPKQSFYDVENKLYSKFTFHGSFEIQAKKSKMIYIPSFMIVNQGPSSEKTLGLLLKYKMGKRSKETDLTFGIFSRFKDATIFYFAFDYKKKYSIGLSYDINTSKLQQATHSRGGFELNFIYKIAKKKVTK